MGVHFQPPMLEHALDEIEGRILPSIGDMVDSLIDAAASARAGEDAEGRGAELRRVVAELQEVTRQLEMLKGSKRFF